MVGPTNRKPYDRSSAASALDSSVLVGTSETVRGTGLRPGEVLALCWDVIDWEAGTVEVRRGLQRSKDGRVFSIVDTLKTPQSKRVIELPADLIAALRQVRADRREHKMAARVWRESDAVFVRDENGRLFRHTTLNWYCAKACRAIGVEPLSANKLRHTNASMLLNRGVKVPEKLEPMRDGNRGFDVTDPDGHDVEFVELRPGSMHSREFGKFLPEGRISQRIIHIGVVVNDRAAADRFYKDILGFQEIWHGGMKDKETDWVDMRVPDGTDWLEYMLNVHNPDPQELGVMNHLALGVPSVKAGYETALKRGYKASEKPQIGRDGKWQFNLYDPNFTRVELMEPKPVQKPCCSPMLQ